jgi:hypothetical protein
MQHPGIARQNGRDFEEERLRPEISDYGKRRGFFARKLCAVFWQSLNLNR